MNKKTNTLLFVLAGTVFNIIVTILTFIVLLVFFSKVLAPSFPDAIAWAIPVIFVLSIIVSFFVYRQAVKLLMSKIDMEKYFDPIFGRQKR